MYCTKRTIKNSFDRKNPIINIKSLNIYTKKKNDFFYIDKLTGLIIRNRKKSNKFTADQYSKKVFSKKTFSAYKYSDQIPATKARQKYVYDTINEQINLKNKSVLDVGAGSGNFLQLFKTRNKFGVEPQKYNCILMKKKKIKHHLGTTENLKKKKKFDILTFLWVLSATYNPLDVIKDALRFAKKDSYIVLGDSSRILVHPRKNLSTWIGKQEGYLSPYKFSLNQLKSILIFSGFEVVYVNQYFDTDYVVVIGKKTKKKFTKYPIDNYKNVLKFFALWKNIDNKLNKLKSKV